MASQLLNIPIGSAGAVVVSESAGIVSLSVNCQLASNAVQVSGSISGGLPALLNLVAAEVSNATIKSIIQEAASLAAALPA